MFRRPSDINEQLILVLTFVLVVNILTFAFSFFLSLPRESANKRFAAAGLNLVRKVNKLTNPDNKFNQLTNYLHKKSLQLPLNRKTIGQPHR